ncbi:UNVERIFIED_CONTAM: hypothetical protein GTU68_025066 [Idotea baltica]|nr:hypothetical protein [Idotea baltica]
MVQGTTSDAGKSVLVAGLCRVLARKGIKVAPFKPQNMALNSAVTKDGGEIGRAQAVQAQACNIEPSVHMNPVLLKPNSDTGAQVILQGRALSNMEATGYHDYKKVAMNTVIDSFDRLSAEYESVMIEGAGSPAEINLRENDIANMGFAEKADIPVIIVADIDRGGSDGEAKLKVVVPVLTRISNHTDFDALRLNPSIDLRYVGKGERVNNADLIILPGTKSVRADLDYLKEQGWDKDIQRHLRLGGKVMGICGGYQMLGKIIHDPDGVEGEPGTSEGLGYLDTETTLTQQKTLTNVRGTMTLDGKSAQVKGYEIHVGRTDVNETALPVQLESGCLDGAVNQENSIFGTYLHGVFDNSDALSLICEWAGANDVTAIDHEQLKELGINRIADAIEEHLNLDLLWPELKA